MALDLRAIPLEIDSGKTPYDRYKWDEITPVNGLFNGYTPEIQHSP